MNLIRSWREQKILLKRIFPYLSDADLEYKDNQKEPMMDALAFKLKKTREELRLLFKELQAY